MNTPSAEKAEPKPLFVNLRLSSDEHALGISRNNERSPQQSPTVLPSAKHENWREDAVVFPSLRINFTELNATSLLAQIPCHHEVEVSRQTCVVRTVITPYQPWDLRRRMIHRRPRQDEQPRVLNGKTRTQEYGLTRWQGNNRKMGKVGNLNLNLNLNSLLCLELTHLPNLPLKDFCV